jgi:hypothetical protein
MHLAKLRFQFLKEDGSLAKLSDIQSVNQTLDLWTGEIRSEYMIEGKPVKVFTFCHQKSDQILVKVESELLIERRLLLNMAYPEPLDNWKYGGNFFGDGEGLTTAVKSGNNFEIRSPVKGHDYQTLFSSSGEIKITDQKYAWLSISPESETAEWSFSVTYNNSDSDLKVDEFETAQAKNRNIWESFWNSGGMIDLGRVEDKRAGELERRMILSMYLTKVNCGGSSFPQETGLTYNSWYGKPHMEMPWWHSTHWPLWGRSEILRGQMSWYTRAMPQARAIAERQGFSGVRWQKMTDNQGGETVSSVGSYLLWNQPHPIWFAELLYEDNGSHALKTYGNIVEQTAEFMADFAWKDSTGRYILGPGVIPAQERFNPQDTYNPTYELAYWRWALETAQSWRERIGKPRKEKWDDVLQNLSNLPQKEGVYLATESTPDSYTTEKFMTDHPSVLGTYGMLPETSGLDKAVMKATFEKIWTDWKWHDTWGWDFPMASMTATRLGMKEKALDALLMPIKTNTYLKNGHNFQDQRLAIYLPGNGGLLTALAMMATSDGFPEEWEVRWEGLRKMP